MALPQSLLNLSDTLSYFDKYDYPLTLDEIKYWSSATHPLSFPLSLVKRGDRGELYFLPGRSHLVKLRKQREQFSKAKWVIAHHQAAKLAKLPFVMAIFVTGALAMNNCPKDDDIDLMIITKSNTLWITRFFVNLFLNSHRRHPDDKTAPNKICLNLWLDTNNLVLHAHSIYTAHEILQAKCIFDRGGIHRQFLKQNSWVKKYLPVAYKSQAQNSLPADASHQAMQAGKGQINSKSQFPNTNLVIRILNLMLFVLQWLYMKPKMTTERVSLGYAFFHPTKQS